MKTIVTRSIASAVIGLALGLFSTGSIGESFSGGEPLSPQPDPAGLKPGLSVTYYFDFYDHIDDISGFSGGKVGEPIMNIAHRTKTGNVMTADRPMGVGVHIRGMILLDQPGTYVFRIESNDGIKAHIGGIHLWTDPEIHPNRWSRPLEYDVTETGWYDLSFDYYQRKGTSALQLVWTRPGSEEEVVVPPEAFAHQ
jgi:hypothetical protein